MNIALQQFDIDWHLEKALNRFVLPDIIYATKASPDSPECYGSDRSIQHSHWAVENQIGRHRTRLSWLNFDSIVDAGGVRLTAGHLRSDYLVKKIIILVSLGAGNDRAKSFRVTDITGQFYDRFVRWRLSIGLANNELIEKQHFEQYGENLSGDLLDTVPIYERLDKVFDEIQAGAINFNDFYKPAEKNKRQIFNWELLSDLLGVTKVSISTSRPFVVELCDRISSLEHETSSDLVRSFSRSRNERTREDYSESVVHKLMLFWHNLHKLTTSGLLPRGGLTFNPFEKLSVKQTALRVKSRPPGRTPTLAPDDFVRLLQTACTWAFEYGDYILEAAESRRTYANKNWYKRAKDFNEYFDRIRPAGAPKLHHGWTISKADTALRSERLPLGDAMKHLITSCAIIIGCFSARRGGEIAMLLGDCIKQTGAQYHLEVYIEKTLQRVDRIPVPKMVAAAVDVLKAATGQLGENAPPKPLFHVVKKDASLFFEFTACLKAFTIYNKMPPPAGEKEWTFTSHQLRRGTAIYFYYGNDWGDLDNVANLLRHFDPEMSRVYLTEAVAGAIANLEDELRARSEVARIKNSKALKAWVALVQEELGNLRAIVSENEDVRLSAYVYRMLNKSGNGLEDAIGHGVKRMRMDLAAMIEAAAADVRVTSGSNDPDIFMEALVTRIKRGAANRFLEPVPGGVAHCTANLNGGDDLTLAECNKLAAAGRAPWETEKNGRCSKVDLAFSGAYPCLNCIYGVMFKSNQRVIQEKLVAIGKTVDTAPSKVAAQARQAQYDRLHAAFRAATSAAKKA
ncbi:site-specific integrase [Rhizobium rhizogenes]|uniref:site-specific integrase n=1 Tax=Rhizobium rhizogenes TaxID=359 RepID=UPI001571DE99|nr:site-specific integrase [Rhizobium rhizogenes]NTF49050.1 site-specific integrase [Rhizobium rhizogenes]NTH06434.1 site-specific integrase [Rhizobium rhizogenes]